MNLSKVAKVDRVMNAVAAGTTDQNSASVNMKGFGGVQFVAMMGAILASATTSMKLAEGSTATAFVDLAGTSIAIATTDANKAVVSDLIEPRKQFIRATIDRGGANAVIDGILAIQYGPAFAPVTHATTVVSTVETHASPATGTA